MALLPLIEMVARGFGTNVPGSGSIVQHLALWIAFLGAALAAREGKLLALSTGEFLPQGGWRRFATLTASTVAACVTTLLARGSYDFVASEREFKATFGNDWPAWIAQLVLPIAFAAIALRIVWRAGESYKERAIAATGIALGLWLGAHQEILEGASLWPAYMLIAVATALGGPLFAAIGGTAALLFLSDGIVLQAIPIETYRLAVSPHLAAIPLFTLTGFLLAEGEAPNRLLAVFRAFFGWIPGGTAVVCAALCAFMTVFTGGSGVTILALGGLLFRALQAERYRERFSLGLLTASGSLGLLLPPALPLILYGIVAQIPIKDLFLGGILPGLLLVVLIAAWGVREGLKTGAERRPFELAPALDALWKAKFELLLPALVLVAIFGGFATLVEAAAISVVYTFLVQSLFHRDISLRGDLLRILRECSLLVGGVLLILAVSMGLTSYIVDAQVPDALLGWVREYVDSPLVFLLCLNVFLLIVGCLMDIFSATVVVVPLIIPLGAEFGIDPVHLGIIFIANLELGYLTPPVGLNLFLASYRFERPLMHIYRSALPMLLILGIGVLLITYMPWLTTALPQWFGGEQ